MNIDNGRNNILSFLCINLDDWDFVSGRVYIDMVLWQTRETA
jgi:predicted transcriptional regulator YheO